MKGETITVEITTEEARQIFYLLSTGIDALIEDERTQRKYCQHDEAEAIERDVTIGEAILERFRGLVPPEVTRCPHSLCSQHYIDTGDAGCIEGEE